MSSRVEVFTEWTYGLRVRSSVIAACFASLVLFAGCYSPKVNNGGFACSPTDDPPCPKGFFCVSGLCVDSPNAVVPTQDLSTGTGGNGGSGGGGGGGGGGGSSGADMASPPGADLSMPPGADLATPPMCAAQGSACNSNTDCCNMVCFPGPGLCVL